MQFLAPDSNQRTDAWGGSPAKRIRFAVETARAVAEAIGAEKVGFRVSPGHPFNDIDESDAAETEATYTALAEALAPMNLAYLHQVGAAGQAALTGKLRKTWPGTYILNPFSGKEPTGPDALALIEDGPTDLVAYGAMFLANPDLPARLAQDGPYNTPDPTTFFGGDEKGFTDYPTLAEAGA